MTKKELINKLQLEYWLIFNSIKHNYNSHTIELKWKLYQMNKKILQASPIWYKFISSDDLKLIWISVTDYRELFNI